MKFNKNVVLQILILEMKKNEIFFAVILLFTLCISCNKKEKDGSIENLDKTATWLENEKNFEDKQNYQSVFLKEYDRKINGEKYEDAKLLLYHYGKLLYKESRYDSIYKKNSVEFINANFPVKKDTILSWNLYFLGNQFKKVSEFDKAIVYEKKSLEINPDKKSNIYGKTLSSLGVNYSYINQNDKAISYFLQAIPLAEKMNDYSELGSLYNNLAYTYEQAFANDESKKNYKKAGFYFLKAKDTSNYFALQTTFAYNHFNISRDTLQTIQLIDSVFTVYDQFKNPIEEDESNANFTKAFKYFLRKDYDKALAYLDKSSAFYIKTNNLDYLRYNTYLEIEINFYKDKTLKNQKAVETLAQELFENESLSESIDLYNILYENELYKKNVSKALLYKNKATKIQNEVLKNNQNGQLFELEQKYQTVKKERTIADQKNKLAQNKLYLIILIITILAIILSTFLFFMRRKRREMIESNKRQEQFTFQLLQNTEEERNRIANELHDSVNHDLLNIKNTLINGKNIEVKTLENVIEEVRNISRNLHPAVLQNMGFEASIESLCERLTNEAGLFTTCDIEYEKKLSKSKELQLYRIIQEALNNTLKHGKANAAKVIVVSSESKLHVEIKDNGSGFNVTEHLNSSKSFGLQSILQRAKAIAAKINIESSEKGTSISLNINF